jgi:hypothetical protein
MRSEDADRIAAKPEKGRMAEADQRAVAKDKVQRQGRQRKDHHAGQQAERVFLRPEHGGEGQRQQRREQQQGQPLTGEKAARREASLGRKRGDPGLAHLRTGNRPAGRKNSTAAIRM